MMDDEIIIHVMGAFLRPYPVLVGEVVLAPGTACLGRPARLHLTPTTYRTITLESEVTASRWDPSRTLRGFTYSGDLIEPSEVGGGAILTTLPYRDALRYSKHHASNPRLAPPGAAVPTPVPPERGS
jgi:hypothetical protein